MYILGIRVSDFTYLIANKGNYLPRICYDRETDFSEFAHFDISGCNLQYLHLLLVLIKIKEWKDLPAEMEPGCLTFTTQQPIFLAEFLSLPKIEFKEPLSSIASRQG